MKCRYLLAVFVCAVRLLAQSSSPGTPTSAAYPGHVATDSDMLVASDHCQTTLTASIIATDTSIPLASSTNCVANQIINIEQEQMKITTPGVPATVIRHWSGTTAASHSSGALVYGRISAVYHNQFKTELIGTESSQSTATYRGTFPGAASSSASWPNHVATTAELYSAADTGGTLTAPMGANDLTFVQSGGTYLGANQVGKIDSELVLLCSASTICTGGRGYGVTTPAPHAIGATIFSDIATIMWLRGDYELIALETDLWGRAGSTTNCPCTAGSGASWPNHIVTLAELGAPVTGGAITANFHNRRSKELQALQSDLAAHPVPPSPPAPPPPPTGSVDLFAGPYTGCPGSGCAKGNYRSGTDGSVSSSNFTLNASAGNFTSQDVGKRGVAVDWFSSNITGVNDNYGSCSSWSGYACYAGTSCEFTVSSVNSSTSINVSPVNGCGGSGIINSYPGSSNWYWALYSDDSTALGNALSAAAAGSSHTLLIPANAQVGIYTGQTIPSGVTISCSSGSSFNDPHLNTSTTFMFTAGSSSTITGCILSGTQNPSGPWYDVLREYNIAVGVFTSNFTFTFNTVKNQWGTYAIGTSGGSGHTITHNTFSSCGYYGVQLNQAASTSVSNNTFTNCNYGSEDSSGVSGTPNTGQTISSNTVTATTGQGYYRTQSSHSLFNAGAAWLDCGTSASGGSPNSNEYSGVTCSGNSVSGTNTFLYYNTGLGETVSSNTCTSGCAVN